MRPFSPECAQTLGTTGFSKLQITRFSESTSKTTSDFQRAVEMAETVGTTMPVCWNWQTRWTQNPLVATPCGFDPRHRHQIRGILWGAPYSIVARGRNELRGRRRNATAAAANSPVGCLRSERRPPPPAPSRNPCESRVSGFFSTFRGRLFGAVASFSCPKFFLGVGFFGSAIPCGSSPPGLLEVVGGRFMH